MSLKWKGKEDGHRDGEFDASNGLDRKPRPRFMSSLVSDGYREAYMRAYRYAYDQCIRSWETEVAQQLAQNSKLISGEQVPRDQVYERGWRDGFSGKDTPPGDYRHDEIRIYERGHRKGVGSGPIDFRWRA